jgi:hypothetical protein
MPSSPSTAPESTTTSRLRRLLQRVLQFLRATIQNPYDTLEKPARTLKILAQMLVGILLVVSVSAQLIAAFQKTQETTVIWQKFDSTILLDTIADALLVATAIELGYLLFTDGPDEAINPLITALAAAILLSIPAKAATPDVDLKGAIAVAVFSLILALLIWVRARYLESERKRKALELQASNSKFTDTAEAPTVKQ